MLLLLLLGEYTINVEQLATTGLEGKRFEFLDMAHSLIFSPADNRNWLRPQTKSYLVQSVITSKSNYKSAQKSWWISLLSPIISILWYQQFCTQRCVAKLWQKLATFYATLAVLVL